MGARGTQLHVNTEGSSCFYFLINTLQFSTAATISLQITQRFAFQFDRVLILDTSGEYLITASHFAFVSGVWLTVTTARAASSVREAITDPHFITHYYRGH